MEMRPEVEASGYLDAGATAGAAARAKEEADPCGVIARNAKARAEEADSPGDDRKNGRGQGKGTSKSKSQYRGLSTSLRFGRDDEGGVEQWGKRRQMLLSPFLLFVS